MIDGRRRKRFRDRWIFRANRRRGPVASPGSSGKSHRMEVVQQFALTNASISRRVAPALGGVKSLCREGRDRWAASAATSQRPNVTPSASTRKSSPSDQTRAMIDDRRHVAVRTRGGLKAFLASGGVRHATSRVHRQPVGVVRSGSATG